MAQGFWILSMFNHDPNHGDNVTCDCCGDVFDARNSVHDIVTHNGNDKWVCGDCLDLPEEDLKEALAIRD